MPQLAPWRELARKAAQAIKRQLAQTESGLSALLNPSRRPQSIPIPIPIPRREPRFPNSKRFYTQFLPHRTSRATQKRPSQFVKTEFGRTQLRPRLSGTTRAHGYRSFSSSPVNHTHVMREVQASIAQGIRAGVLNTPFFPPPSVHDKSLGKVLHGVMGSESTRVATTLSMDLLPPSLIMPRQGELTRAIVAEVDEAILSFPQFMAKLRRDLNALARSGVLEYHIKDNTMHFVFPGKTKDQVERWLRDIHVTRGTVTESHSPVQSAREEEDVDWNAVFDARMSRSLEAYVDAIDAQRCGHAIMTR